MRWLCTNFIKLPAVALCNEFGECHLCPWTADWLTTIPTTYDVYKNTWYLQKFKNFYIFLNYSSHLSAAPSEDETLLNSFAWLFWAFVVVAWLYINFKTFFVHLYQLRILSQVPIYLVVWRSRGNVWIEWLTYLYYG